MKAIIQRVTQASVSVNNQPISQIGQGFLVLLGINKDDTEKQVVLMAKKIINLRIMADSRQKMNLSLKEVKGEMLVVSQFTLYGDCQKGNRPSFIQAARPEKAEKLYNLFVKLVSQTGIPVQTGIFGAMMAVSLVNDGPVTIIVES